MGGRLYLGCGIEPSVAQMRGAAPRLRGIEPQLALHSNYPKVQSRSRNTLALVNQLGLSAKRPLGNAFNIADRSQAGGVVLPSSV